MPYVLTLLIVMSYCVATLADDDAKPPEVTAADLKGTKAGEAKDLMPGVAFHWCPPGKFPMGEDNKKVTVELTAGFWLGETEITQGQWQKVMETTPWSDQEFVMEGANYPATHISQLEATAYCEKLTLQERAANRLPKEWKYALPTEAQWEYACRAGTNTKFWFGRTDAQATTYDWIIKNTHDFGEQYAHQVGKKKPNPWGFRDMHGNVMEWSRDCLGTKRENGRDPQGPETSSYRAFRGGCWRYGSCPSSYRGQNPPDYRSYTLGFRLAVVPE